MELPSLSSWTSVFLVAAGMGVFAALLLLFKSKERRINLFPAFVLLAYSLVLVQYVLFWSKYMFDFPYLVLIPEMLFYAIPPTIYWYARQKRGDILSPIWGLAYIPAAAVLVLNFCFWLGIFSWSDYRSGSIPTVLLGLKTLVNWQLVVGFYLILMMMIFLLQKPNLHDNPSVHAFNQVIKYLVVFLGVFTVAYASYYILVRFPFFNLNWDYAISVVMSLGIYLTAAAMYLNPGWLEEELSNGHNALEKSALLSPSTSREIFEQVCASFERNQWHRDENLRVETLASKLELPRHYVSHAINVHSGKNFNRFVNGFRLTDAENMLEQNPDLSIKSIYFQVGFSNKATFYEVFKEKHGCTPSEFRKRLLLKTA